MVMSSEFSLFWLHSTMAYTNIRLTEIIMLSNLSLLSISNLTLPYKLYIIFIELMFDNPQEVFLTKEEFNANQHRQFIQ